MPTPSSARYADVFFAHRGNVSDKWSQYLEAYDEILTPLIQAGDPVRLLEIGVQNGGSLEIWAKLLPPGSGVVGVDIDPDCLKIVLPPQANFILGNAAEPEIVPLLGDELFDVIIDDGSHAPADVIRTFDLLIDRLKPGGLYIIEDCHASYWTHFGGGYLRANSAIEWFKTMIDALHGDYIEVSDRLVAPGADRLMALNQLIRRLTAYDSVLVIATHKTPKLQQHHRVIAGCETPVFDTLKWASEQAAFGRGIHLTPPAHEALADRTSSNSPEAETSL